MSIRVKSIILIVVVWIFTGIGWHTVYGDYAACFNSERDYKEFLIDNRDYLVTFPCPTNDNLLNQTLPIGK